MTRYQSIAVLLLVSFNLVNYANKMLIFCSEGSPSGFDPGQYHSSIDYDASAETLFNRLI
ncbi:MAG: hypothetical protein IPK86_01735 [Neisseriales bacterium]|nr:MAG: hypothetical protein IPK86_01735 [Neisseriales bacterium]